MKKEITDIKQNKSNKNHSVFINNEFAFSLPEIDILYYKMAIGNEITDERIAYIQKHVIEAKAVAVASKYLSFKPRTKKEVIKKLQEKEFTQNVIEKTVDLMEEYNYINDVEYIHNYIDAKKTLGKRRIKQELIMRGVDRDAIEKVFLSHFTDGEEITDTIAALFDKKLRGNKNPDQKERERAFNFVGRRGFSFSEAKEGYARYLELDD